MSDTYRELATELLAALEAEHRAIDMLLANRARAGMDLARVDRSVSERDFFPSTSPAWPALVRGAEIMKIARELLR